MVLPSGELHIREVGPEDGYKSYQCRTKHRLTGETRLSATKGRLVITEPLGRVSPKLDSTSKIVTAEVRRSNTIALLCSAQGYPIAVFSPFRCLHLGELLMKYHFPRASGMICFGVASKGLIFRVAMSLLNVQKPIGSVAPRLTSGDAMRVQLERLTDNITLLCPAQSYPVPAFRTNLIKMVPNSTDMLVLLCLRDAAEPVGSVAPRLTSGDESRKLLVQRDANVTMLCPAQSFPVPVFR
uniref:Ig-like domain-containing protein n=1 Tax=Anopheles maculatus TaxID=74869 RepID=A0A182T3B0_9DIPT